MKKQKTRIAYCFFFINLHSSLLLLLLAVLFWASNNHLKTEKSSFSCFNKTREPIYHESSIYFSWPGGITRNPSGSLVHSIDSFFASRKNVRESANDFLPARWKQRRSWKFSFYSHPLAHVLFFSFWKIVFLKFHSMLGRYFHFRMELNFSLILFSRLIFLFFLPQSSWRLCPTVKEPKICNCREWKLTKRRI